MTQKTDDLPSLHDGSLAGIIVKDEEARLLVTDAAGASFTIVLSGVRRLNADGFAEGNIILDCYISEAPDVPDDVLAAVTYGDASDKAIGPLRSSVAEGSYRVFVLEPSYGATVVALIKSISVNRGFVLGEMP